MTVPCHNDNRSAGKWLIIAIAITVASMSANKRDKAAHSVSRAEQTIPRVTLTLPLN